MQSQEILENFLTDETILVMSKNKIGKYNKKYAIFIKKYNQDGTKRTINDIINQLNIYFKKPPSIFYCKINNTIKYINKNTNLETLKILWVY